MKKVLFLILVFAALTLLDGTAVLAQTINELKSKAIGGDPKSQTFLCFKYLKADGVPLDYDKSKYWCTMAANQGFPAAINNLGVGLATGKGMPKNMQLAYAAFHLANKLGHPVPRKIFDAVSQNLERSKLEQAIKLSEQCAEDNFKNCFWVNASASGLISDFSNGLEAFRRKEYEKAFSIWERYARDCPFGSHDCGAAMYNLSQQLKEGQGIERDMKESVYWLQRAAALGHVKAQHNLAVRLFTGTGISKNFKDAAILMRIAAASGNKKSKELLPKFLELLSSKEKQEANEIYEQCVSSNLTNCIPLISVEKAEKSRLDRAHKTCASRGLKQGSIDFGACVIDALSD